MLCDAHESAVLAALNLLGIGCIGERVTFVAECKRCVAEASGVPNRTYVAAAGELS